MNQFISMSAIGLGLALNLLRNQLHRKLALGQKSSGESVGGDDTGMDRRTESSAARQFRQTPRRTSRAV